MRIHLIHNNKQAIVLHLQLMMGVEMKRRVAGKDATIQTSQVRERLKKGPGKGGLARQLRS